MHRQTLVALSWCLILGMAIAVLLEVHRSHANPPPQPVPPITDTYNQASVPPTRGLPAPEPQAATADNYRGNTNTQKFHRKGCRHFSCTNCTVKFATREEAIQAGFRPCGTCDP